MSSNLPPGVSVNDIPGDRAEDELFEKLFDRLPASIQEEIENDTALGRELESRFEDLVGSIFTEEDALKEMQIIEPLLRQQYE